MPIAIFLAIIGWTLLGLESKQKEEKTIGFQQEKEAYVIALSEQDILA